LLSPGIEDVLPSSFSFETQDNMMEKIVSDVIKFLCIYYFENHKHTKNLYVFYVGYVPIACPEFIEGKGG
jgi:hypothetical protein